VETTVRYRAPVLSGGVLFGRYLIGEELGDGGMATVHRAEMLCAAGVRKAVALKRMHSELAADPELVAAFVREAQLATRLAHPNIAQPYELGRVDNTYFIAMELVTGPTLADIIKRGARVPLAIAVDILIQLCDALEHVHELRDDGGRSLGVIHRDVSPSNVILSSTGTVKLIDFGIAKLRSNRAATEAGVLKGKHAYLAPEYTYGRLDQRADLFAVGVVAHELLTGQRLFRASREVDAIRAVRERAIEPPSRLASHVPRELDAIVLRALERDPTRRWQSASAMRAALTRLVRERGLAVRGREIHDWLRHDFHGPPSRPTIGRALVARRHRGRTRRKIAWLAAALLVVAGLCAYFY
jgi:serine/threonine protein kinase